MIKFFRRIRYNLMNENKTGKYLKYAIGEILLVVIGILIALQINNWNQINIEKKLEQELLLDLKNEFTTNQKALNTMITNHQWIYKGCIDFLRFFGPNKEIIDEEQFNSFMGMTGWTPSLSLQKGVLNSTLNSGKIGLIRNDSLVFSLSSLSSIEKPYYDNIKLINKLVEDNIIPFLLENYSYINMDTGEYSSKTRSKFKTNQLAILRSQKMESLVDLKRLNTQAIIETAEILSKSQGTILRLIEINLNNLSSD